MKDTEKNKKASEKNSQSAHSVSEVVAFCRKHKLDAEVVGVWVWVSFDEKPEDGLRKLLKEFGFKFSTRRRKWAHSCGTPSRAGKGNPWEKYSVRPIGAVA